MRTRVAWDALDHARVNTKGGGGGRTWIHAGAGRTRGPWGDLGMRIAHRRVAGCSWDRG